MENKQLITLAYELAKTKYKNKPFTFEHLWADLVKKAKLDKDEQKNAGYVYTCMLQDRRFIFVGNKEWQIREFLTIEQQKEQSHKLYDFSKETEQAKQIADKNDKEMYEQENYRTEEQEEEIYKDNKNRLAYDTDQDDDEPETESKEQVDEE